MAGPLWPGSLSDCVEPLPRRDVSDTEHGMEIIACYITLLRS